jgi:hypothetical protein
MVLRPNPFYGVGLAVHDRVADCPECDHVEYLPHLHPKPESAGKPKRSLLRRMRGAVERREK